MLPFVCDSGIAEIEMKTPVIRIVSISWMFTCIVISVTYGSNLIALLTVDIDYPPFRNLEALSTHDQYKFGTLGGTYMTNLFQVRNTERNTMTMKNYVTISCYFNIHNFTVLS